MYNLWDFAAISAVSFMVSLLFVYRPSLLSKKQNMLLDISATQSQHVRLTSRLGGVGVIFSFAAGCLIYGNQMGADLKLALAAGLLVFWFGLREDINRNVSPRARLLAALGAGGIAIALTGTVVPDLGIVDGSLKNWMLPAIAVTLLWSAGTCHALNLIDGLNGLSSLYSISASLGIFAIAGYTGDADLQLAAALLIAALLGFFVLNWPFGRIFLGDAGAYGTGHILAWLSILLVARNPQVAPMAVLLLLFWPVCETLFSIVRRRILRRPTGQPDRLHFHHLAVRGLPVISRRSRRKWFDNPIGTLILVPFFGVPIVAGVYLWDEPVWAGIVLGLFIALFGLTYSAVKSVLSGRRFAGKLRASRMTWKTEAPQLHRSLLSGTYGFDGKKFDVLITRAKSRSRWRLQVTADGRKLPFVVKRFKTDDDAYAYFLSYAGVEGSNAALEMT